MIALPLFLPNLKLTINNLKPKKEGKQQWAIPSP